MPNLHNPISSIMPPPQTILPTIGKGLSDENETVQEGARVAIRTLGALIVDLMPAFDTLGNITVGNPPDNNFGGFEFAVTIKSVLDFLSAILSRFKFAFCANGST